MNSKTYIGDTGTVIVTDCGTDISAASARQILARKPDGTTVTWSASASGANAISYTTQAGDLDQTGTWRLQAKVTIGSGVWLGETALLEVNPQFA